MACASLHDPFEQDGLQRGESSLHRLEKEEAIDDS
jgi:hypothetical protein